MPGLYVDVAFVAFSTTYANNGVTDAMTQTGA